MSQGLITEEQARDILQEHCHNAGGVGKLAEAIGISIAAVSQQLHGHKPIHGKVAKYLGIKLERETTVHYRKVS